MKVFCKKLNPCAARSTNLKQYQDYIAKCGHTIVENADDADTVLIWGCGFRTDYQNNTLERANYYKNIGKRVILAGCIPDINPTLVNARFSVGGDGDNHIVPWRKDDEELKKIFASDGSDDCLESVNMVFAQAPLCLDANEYKKDNPDSDACYLDEHIKLYVSEGCTLTCNYCSEKLMFPAYCSYPMDKIIEQAKREVTAFSRKYPREVSIPLMLQADSVGDYGCDINSSLPELLENLIALDDRVKVGLQGFNPYHFLLYKKEMMSLLERNRLFHLRLPIQNGNDRMLESMGRKYRVKDIDEIFNSMNKIGYRDYSTDIIIGFPGETNDSYQQTIDLVLKYSPKYILLSAYMDFEGLPSYTFDNKVDDQLKIERLKKASDIFRANGIYCSTDGGEMTDDRRRRMNNDNRIM